MFLIEVLHHVDDDTTIIDMIWNCYWNVDMILGGPTVLKYGIWGCKKNRNIEKIPF